MNIILDTSVVIAVIGEEPHKPAIIKATAGKTLLAPPSLPWETGNALSSLLKRKKISSGQAEAALEIFKQIPIRLVSIDLNNALELCHTLNIYAYDAYILCAALQHKCPLLSLDNGVLHHARTLKIKTLGVSL
jgi:predicted nucleic acid-binding protein